MKTIHIILALEEYETLGEDSKRFIDGYRKEIEAIIPYEETETQTELKKLKEEEQELKKELDETEKEKEQIEELEKQYENELKTLENELDELERENKKYYSMIDETKENSFELIDKLTEINELYNQKNTEYRNKEIEAEEETLKKEEKLNDKIEEIIDLLNENALKQEELFEETSKNPTKTDEEIINDILSTHYKVEKQSITEGARAFFGSVKHYYKSNEEKGDEWILNTRAGEIFFSVDELLGYLGTGRAKDFQFMTLENSSRVKKLIALQGKTKGKKRVLKTIKRSENRINEAKEKINQYKKNYEETKEKINRKIEEKNTLTHKANEIYNDVKNTIKETIKETMNYFKNIFKKGK